MVSPDSRTLSRASRVWQGLLFGASVGLIFALVAWGRDALILAGVSAYLAWAKLLAGGVASVVLGGIAGVLVSASDRSQVGLVAWGLAAVVLGWIATHLPYEGLSQLGGWLDPRFDGLNIYPFVSSARVRGTFATVIITGLFALGGAYQLSTLDMIHAAYSRVGRLLPLVLPVGLVGIAGLAVDGLVNAPLRASQVEVVRLIRFVLERGDEAIDSELAREMHISSLQSVREILAPPQEVMLSAYDARSLSTLTVDVDLGQDWIRCTALGSQVVYCARGDLAYQRAFTCLLQLPADPMAECNVGLGPEARAWLEAHEEEVGPEPQVDVVARLGRMAFVEGRGASGQGFECRVRGTQPIHVETCDWLAVD